jgi:hypothetical protein
VSGKKRKDRTKPRKKTWAGPLKKRIGAVDFNDALRPSKRPPYMSPEWRKIYGDEDLPDLDRIKSK